MTVYWEALAAPRAERTVSVRDVVQNRSLLAQKDGQPGQAGRPTSWWEPGWYFRDVYTMVLLPGVQAGSSNLNLLLDNSVDLERVLFDNNEDVLY